MKNKFYAFITDLTVGNEEGETGNYMQQRSLAGLEPGTLWLMVGALCHMEHRRSHRSPQLSFCLGASLHTIRNIILVGE